MSSLAGTLSAGPTVATILFPTRAGADVGIAAGIGWVNQDVEYASYSGGFEAGYLHGPDLPFVGARVGMGFEDFHAGVNFYSILDEQATYVVGPHLTAHVRTSESGQRHEIQLFTRLDVVLKENDLRLAVGARFLLDVFH